MTDFILRIFKTPIKNLDWKVIFFSLLFILSVFLCCCERPVLPLEARKLTEITVSCEQTQFPKDLYIPCHALGAFSDKTQESVTELVTWSDDNSILDTGSGNNAGWIRATGTGNTNLKAKFGHIEATLPLTVTTATVVACTVTPLHSAYHVGQIVQYSSVCIFSDNTYIDVTNSATWTSSSMPTATISTDFGHRGEVLATTEGTSIITATFNSVQGSTDITVLAKQLLLIQIGPKLGTVVQGLGMSFTATGIYTDLSAVDITPITTWSVTDSTVGSISNSLTTAGQFTALQPGSTLVIANFGGLSDFAAVSVTNPILNSITLTPINPSFAKGLTQPITATGHYSDGSSVDISSFVTWGSSDATIADVGNSVGTFGVVNGLDQGSVTISATLGLVVGQTNVTVTAPELTTIAVTPNNSTISVGDDEQLTAIGTYTDNSSLDITNSVTWMTTNGSIASVSNTPGTQGLATAVSSGNAIFLAMLGPITGQTNVTVVPATLLSITVAPINPTISGIGSRQLTATGHYSDGSDVDITSSVVWATGNSGVVTVSNSAGSSGVATGVSIGSTFVSATFGIISGQTTVTVIAPVLMSINVTPSNSTITLLATKQFTATGIYADGSTTNLTANVTWASSNTLSATISNTAGSKGRATGLALGSTTITATLGLISGSTILTSTLF